MCNGTFGIFCFFSFYLRMALLYASYAEGGGEDHCEFHGTFFPHFQHSFLLCWFTTLAKDSWHAWRPFGANIGWTHHLGSSEAANGVLARIRYELGLLLCLCCCFLLFFGWGDFAVCHLKMRQIIFIVSM